MKAAVRGLASGEKGFEKYKKILGSSFVFLNSYCRSVAEEHKPRGPEGPYRFNDRSVPVLVIKKWDGTTFVQQLGFVAGKKQGMSRLSQFIDKAAKKNGPVVAPKALRPLIKAYAAGVKALGIHRTRAAIVAFKKVLKGAADKKKFPQPPSVALKAAKHLETFRKECEAEIVRIAAGADADPAGARKAYRRLLRKYSASSVLKKKLRLALKALPQS